MRLYEFQAKKIFEENNIRVPKQMIAYSPIEARKIAEDFGKPVVIKAQVLVGGRGLAGGVKFAEDPNEAEAIASEMLGGGLKGESVNCVLIYEKVGIEKEYYAGVTIDYNSKKIVVMASSMGGVDIESVAVEHPGEIAREEINSNLGLTDYQTRLIAKKVGLKGARMLSFANILKSLYKTLLKYDANLVEVNPLVLTPEGSFIALDAKITLDDNASFRHRNLFVSLKYEIQVSQTSIENSKMRKAHAEKAGIPTYIELSGNIGIIADGAGTGMLTLDLTRELGGEVETYCELGGKATPDLIEETMSVVSSNGGVRVILVNLIGGLNRMDEMAEGIKSYVSKEKKHTSVDYSNKDIIVTFHDKPEIVVRMSGTLEEEGRKILEECEVESFDNIYDAINRAVDFARRN